MTSILLGTAMALSIIVSIPPAIVAAQTSALSADEKTLIHIEQVLNDADARHDAGQVAKYLDDTFIVKSFENGRHYDKKGTLAIIRDEARSHHKDNPPTLDALKAEASGDSATVTFSYIVAMNTDKLHCHIKDTFSKKDDGWKLVERSGDCVRETK